MESHGNISVLSKNSTFSDNSTSPYRLPGLVAFCAYLGALTFLLSVIMNSLVVIAFIRKPSLITPFTVQFLNFVIIQLCTLLYDGPVNVLCMLDSRVFFYPVFCAFYKFGAWTFPSLALLQQMAIGLDRWSALLAPVWRRTRTVKYGVRLTFTLIGLYFALYVPLFVADTVEGVPHGERCDYHHAWRTYQIIVRTLTFYYPLLFTYLSFPLLVVILRKRRNAKVEQAIITGTKMTGQHSRIEPPDDHYHQENDHSYKVENKTNVFRQNRSLSASVKQTGGETVRRLTTSGGKRSAVRSRLNLSMWMMLVQIVCSFPFTVTYTMIQYSGHEHNPYPYLNDVNGVSILLVAVNVLIDPIMYLIFFQELRTEVFKLFRCRF